MTATANESRRVAEARSRAWQRVRRQRDALRPLGWAVIVAVAAGAFGDHPAPAPHGKGLAVTVALCAFAATLGLAVRDSFSERGQAFQAAIVSAMGAAGIALAALQPKGATDLAAGAAVWMAVARLPSV